MTRPDIDRMAALAEAATEGPWWWGRPAEDPRSREERAKWIADALFDGDRDLWTTWTQEGQHVVIPALTGDGPRAEQNAEFIAAARTFVPQVIAYVRELKAEIENRNEIENEIAALIPESWDDDEAQIAIIERFVRHYAGIEEANNDEV